MKTLLFIFGTRPEAIKMAPVVSAFKKQRGFDTKVCVTAQHREMLDQVLEFFGIRPDFDLNLMKKNQSLFDITAEGLKGFEKILGICRPDVILVQGDTTTAFIGALAGFYTKIKVAHVEAGLRSGHKFSPFPEEVNRVLAGHLADYHFAPTKAAAQNLRQEGIEKNVWVTGNTVIDALFLGLDILNKNGRKTYEESFDFVDFSRKVILVTGHRRESFGEPFKNMCRALKDIAQEHQVEIVYPVHLNPNVRRPVHSLLKNLKRIHLIKPLDYPHFIWLMSKSYMVLTDSGGVQEEAPSLGKPVLVMREVTERTEGIKAGTARKVGTSRASIVTETLKLLRDEREYQKMAKAVNPYGDGKASARILDILLKELG